jgi:hypothetical protein
LRDGKEVPAKKTSLSANKPARVDTSKSGGTSGTRLSGTGSGVLPSTASASRDTEKGARDAHPAPDKSAATQETVDPAKIWEQVCAKIPTRGFLRTLVELLAVAGTEGRNFLLGYPPAEKSAIETLATTSNRRQLETLLKEVSGRDWTAKLMAQEGLAAKKKNDAATSRAEEFKDDPLIQEALEMFKGEIKS